MAIISLAYGNMADDATLAGTGTNVSNLGTTNQARVWRNTSSGYPVTAGFRFELTAVAMASSLALAGLNLGAAAQVRTRVSADSVDLDFTSVHEVGPSAIISYAGGTNGTRLNEFGRLVTVSAGGRVDHDPRAVHNGYLYSQELTNTTAWPYVTRVACSVLNDDTIAYHAAGGKVESLALQLANDDYTLLAEVRLVSGNGSFKFNLDNGTTDIESAETHVATAQWQWFRSTIASGAASSSGRGSIVKASAAGTLQVRGQQISRGAVSLPYRRTLDKALYQCLGLLREPAGTNQFTNTSTVTGVAYTATGAGDAITANYSTGLDGVTSSLGRFQTGTTPRTARFSGVSSGIDATATKYCVSFTYRGTLAQIVGVSARAGAVVAPIDRGALLPGSLRMAYVVITSGAGGTAELDFSIAASASIEFGEIQVEKAQSFPTSLVLTAGAAVTRTALTATVSTSFVSPEGTLYCETVAHQVQPDSTVVTGGVAVKSGSTDLVALRLTQPTATTYADAVVVAGGATTWDAANSTISNGDTVKQALRYKLNDFSVYIDGAQTASNGALTVPTVYALQTLDLMYGVSAPSHLKRMVWWPRGLPAVNLAALTTDGPSAIDYDSGWVSAVRMHFPDGVAPDDWGTSYDVIEPFTEQAVSRGWVEIYDPSKVLDQYDTVDVGRFFIGRHAISPAFNAEYSSMNSGWTDLSTFVTTASGRRIFNSLPKMRAEAFGFPYLSQEEADEFHAMMGHVGLGAEVLYLRDPASAAACQQYGMVGLLAKLDPLRFSQFDSGAAAFQIDKKL